MKLSELIEPVRNILGNPLEAIILFAGCFLFVFVCCLLYYLEETDKEKKKDTLFQWLFLDGLFAVGIGLASLIL